MDNSVEASRCFEFSTTFDVERNCSVFSLSNCLCFREVYRTIIQVMLT